MLASSYFAQRKVACPAVAGAQGFLLFPAKVVAEQWCASTTAAVGPHWLAAQRSDAYGAPAAISIAPHRLHQFEHAAYTYRSRSPSPTVINSYRK